MTKVLLIAKIVEFINKKKFATAAINENFVIFVMLIAFIIETMLMYLAKQAQILALQANNTSIKVLAKYLEYTDVYSFN